MGFRIFVSDTSGLLMRSEGDEIEVFTYTQVKEDDIALFGFESHEDLRLFEQLISVNGVGPKAGLAIMSLGTANRIKSYIVHKDVAAISNAKGIGKKTAERVILELSEKVSALPLGDEEADTAPKKNDEIFGPKAEAAVALTTLGYTKKEAETALRNIEEDMTVEGYIKRALKDLA